MYLMVTTHGSKCTCCCARAQVLCVDKSISARKEVCCGTAGSWPQHVGCSHICNLSTSVCLLVLPLFSLCSACQQAHKRVLPLLSGVFHTAVVTNAAVFKTGSAPAACSVGNTASSCQWVCKQTACVSSRHVAVLHCWLLRAWCKMAVSSRSCHHSTSLHVVEVHNPWVLLAMSVTLCACVLPLLQASTT